MNPGADSVPAWLLQELAGQPGVPKDPQKDLAMELVTPELASTILTHLSSSRQLPASKATRAVAASKPSGGGLWSSVFRKALGLGGKQPEACEEPDETPPASPMPMILEERTPVTLDSSEEVVRVASKKSESIDDREVDKVIRAILQPSAKVRTKGEEKSAAD